MAKVRAVAISVFAAALILGAPPARVGAQQSPEQLQQLVAPVALYPDELLAETLAAATYTSDVDQAARWLQANAGLTSDQIAGAVDPMPWDSSVKALTEFPSVLVSMGQNLSWTSALGDAYFNQPDDVMDAVQALRQRAIAAGTLQSNAQITVTNQNGLIVIEPAAADTVYVPTYDYWNSFGAPIDPWPEFVFAPGFVRGPRVAWSIGFHIGGAWGRVNWGWHNWGFDWSHRRVVFQRQSYVSHSPSVIDRHYQPSGREPSGRAEVRPGAVAPARPMPAAPGRAEVRPGAVAPARPVPAPGRAVERPLQAPPPPKPMAPPKAAPKTPQDSRNNRGFPPAKPSPPATGTHSGAMSGIGHGGAASNNSSRGQASMGARPAPQQHAAPSPPAAGRGRGRV
jgi:hypothetical protein